MTNREMFEYLKVCNGMREYLDLKEYDIFLDSEISIKEVYLLLRNQRIDSNTILYMFCKIFNEFKGEEKILLNILACTINSYIRYFKGVTLNGNLYRMTEILKKDDTTIANLEHRLKLFDTFWLMEFNNLGTFQVHSFMNHDGSGYFNLTSENGRKYDINNVGALIFKDGECIPYILKSREDEDNINKVIKTLNYDICICINRDTICEKLDKYKERY